MDICIDLETLDTHPSAVILSVGMVAFCPEDGRPWLASHAWNLPIQEQLDKGRTISESTLDWWMQQPRETWAAHRDLVRSIDLATIAVDILEWVSDWGGDRVWAKDPDFDCVILESFMTQTVGQTALRTSDLTRFWMRRSVRTLMDLARKHPEWEARRPMREHETQHVAHVDAEDEAEDICAAWQLLGANHG